MLPLHRVCVVKRVFLQTTFDFSSLISFFRFEPGTKWLSWIVERGNHFEPDEGVLQA